MSPHGICKLRNQLTMLFSVHIFISFLSKNILFCVKQTKKRNSYRYGTTWEQANYDIDFIFGWTIPLISLIVSIQHKHLLECNTVKQIMTTTKTEYYTD